MWVSSTDASARRPVMSPRAKFLVVAAAVAVAVAAFTRGSSVLGVVATAVTIVSGGVALKDRWDRGRSDAPVRISDVFVLTACLVVWLGALVFLGAADGSTDEEGSGPTSSDPTSGTSGSSSTTSTSSTTSSSTTSSSSTTTTATTTTTAPLPPAITSDQLRSMLLSSAELLAHYPPALWEADGRGSTLNVSSLANTTLCDGVALGSDALVGEAVVVNEYGPLNFTGAGEQLTSLERASDAQAFLNALRERAAHCPGFTTVQLGSDWSDEAVALTFRGDLQEGIVLDQGAPDINRVYFRKDRVVGLIVIVGSDGNPSAAAIEAAKAAAAYVTVS